MPSNRSQARLYQELADRYGRLVADAFFRAFDNLRAMAEINRVTAAIEAWDIEGALDALHSSGEWLRITAPFGFTVDNDPPAGLTTSSLCALPADDR